MAIAKVNGTVVADSETFEIVDGAVYFPPESIKSEYFQESSLRSTCHWKGVASYYSLNIDGETLPDAAWYYPDPSPAAAKIKGYVAFYPVVKVER